MMLNHTILKHAGVWLVAGFLALFVPAVILAQTAVTAAIVSPADSNFKVGEVINFSGIATGGDGNYSYTWNFGDGTSAAGDGFAKTYTQAGTYTVTLTVSDFAENVGSVSKMVTIENALTPVVVAIDSPSNNSAVQVGQTVNFHATATGGDGNYSYTWNFGDGTSAAGDGFAKTYTQAGTYTVTVTASDFNEQTDADTITLNVQPNGGGNNQVSVDLKANDANGPFTVGPSWVINLSWTSQNATSCAATGDWSGNKATSGTQQVTASSTVGVSHTYTLTCTGPGGSASDSVTVTVVDQNQNDPLTISNIRVTDITRTSAIVRWTTNRPATSRVIYDTTSHPSLSGQSAPNYGYQFSTGTENTGSGKVVEHAVSLTNLAPNTRYYFRVISED